ncbi:MAG: outer membrane lipoprotein carrier protein LolA [Bryobacteraceae bacterium]|nr:outer membrane lipoprotein carrier protein LolA [Bryobacteraceae bacterium]
MMFVRTCRLFAAVALLAAAAGAQSVDATLSRMDALSKGFHGASADVKKISFTYFAKDTDEESGRIFFCRLSPQDMRVLIEFTKPEVRAVAFAKSKVQMYYPKINTVQEYDLGKAARLLDQYLLLGFGSSGSDLRKSYSIKYVEVAAIDGAKADHMFLEPKSGEARQHVRGIDLWIAQPGGYPIRMKVLEPSRDSTEVQYSNVKINPSSVTEASVRLRLPKGVKKETPQK